VAGHPGQPNDRRHGDLRYLGLRSAPNGYLAVRQEQMRLPASVTQDKTSTNLDTFGVFYVFHRKKS
jgi:hypothetical protein